eukprot:12408700-Alexandrium_andersonii.AAC.1
MEVELEDLCEAKKQLQKVMGMDSAVAELDAKIRKLRNRIASTAVSPKKLFEDAEGNHSRVKEKLVKVDDQLEKARQRVEELSAERAETVERLEQAQRLKDEALARLVAANKTDQPVVGDQRLHKVENALEEVRA